MKRFKVGIYSDWCVTANDTSAVRNDFMLALYIKKNNDIR